MSESPLSMTTHARLENRFWTKVKQNIITYFRGPGKHKKPVVVAGCDNIKILCEKGGTLVKSLNC